MVAAGGYPSRRRGILRLLEHVDVLERFVAAPGPTARERLELELGLGLADLLVDALASRPAARAAGPAAVPVLAS